MTLIYGIIIIFIFGGACALSMAEIASVHPTAGGQYHWTSILAPVSASRGLVSGLGDRRYFAHTSSWMLTLGTELLVWRYQRVRMDRDLGWIYHHIPNHGSGFGLVLEPGLQRSDMACLLNIPSHELPDGVV